MGIFKVNDMTCGHCEKAIKAELQKEDSSVIVKLDLKDKTLKVENLPDEKVISLLNEIGYTARPCN
jgi:copper chaperone